jgi:hypothetical protein
VRARGEPGEERPHDPFDPGPVGDQRGRRERDRDPEKARAAVLSHASEHPARHPRQDERAEEREDHDPDYDLQQDACGASVAAHGARDDREHRQRERVRHDGPSARDSDRAVTEQAELLDDRVCDERVRRPQRAEEQRRRRAVAKTRRDRDAERERNGERERAERQSPPAVGRENVEVVVEARADQEEEDSEVAERLDDTLPLDPVENTGANQQATEDDSDDARKAHALEDERPDQYHRERDEEDPLGGVGRELDTEQHGGSVQRPPDGGAGLALRGGEIRELRIPPQPGELDHAGRPVAVLREDHLGDSLLV